MIEIGQGSIHRINILVIGNVVAEIDLGRGVAGSDPDSIYAQLLQVVQLGLDPFEIADTVTIAVGKTARIDLIKNGMLPPRVAFGIHSPSLSLRLRNRKWKART